MHGETVKIHRIVTFLLQKWLRERAAMLRYTHIATIVSTRKMC